MILLINEKKHIGGGQSSVNAYQNMLLKNNIEFELAENSVNKDVFKKLLKKQYHLVFINFFSPKFLALTILIKIINIPIVMSVHNIWHLESKFQNPNQSRKKTLLIKIAQELAFLCCEKLIVFSNYEKKLIEDSFMWIKKKVVIVSGAIDLHHFHPVSTVHKKKIRESIHLPTKSTIFLIAARLEKRKGVEIAIEAFARILKKYPNSLLCIIFPTVENNYYEVITECFKKITFTNIGSSVHFITGVDLEHIKLYFQVCDFFIMSTIDLENFGLATAEALASGCIPIGFNSGATPEILKQVDKKLIAKEVNAISLANRIESVLQLPESKILDIRQKCIRVSKKYSLNNVETKLIKELINI